MELKSLDTDQTLPPRRRPVRLRGLLAAAGFLGCVATVAGVFAPYHWLPELAVHFRVQYALGLLALAVLLLGFGSRRTALILLVFAAFNAWLIIPLFIAPDAPAVRDATVLRLLLQNVNARYGDPPRVMEMIRQQSPDLVVLEEIDAGWVEAVKALMKDYPHRRIEARGDNFGISLYSRWPLERVQVLDLGDSGVPSIQAVVVQGSQRWSLLAIHPPPPIGEKLAHRRNSVFSGIPGVLPTDLPSIVIGDFNTTRWSPHFSRLLNAANLVDSASGFGLQPTWPVGLPLLYLPIDQMLHSKDIVVLDRYTGPDVGSDHRALLVDVALRRYN